MAFKFAVINPLLHNELRLKIMVALDSLDSADFVYLCDIIKPSEPMSRGFGECSPKAFLMRKEIRKNRIKNDLIV